MAAAGPTAEACFRLAELLYQRGDLPAARERYYVAIELDEDYVEARANLGCVLAETGELELAVAAFEGALRYHDEYPDVHYHLARTLDELGRASDADLHWAAFLELAPDSPWAEEAYERLSPQHLRRYGILAGEIRFGRNPFKATPMPTRSSRSTRLRRFAPRIGVRFSSAGRFCWWRWRPPGCRARPIIRQSHCAISTI